MDFGLTFFKKYVAMLTSGLPEAYRNKSVYTAPEFLDNASPVVDKPTEAGDVYSFGLML